MENMYVSFLTSVDSVTYNSKMEIRYSARVAVVETVQPKDGVYHAPRG